MMKDRSIKERLDQMKKIKLEYEDLAFLIGVLFGSVITAILVTLVDRVS